MQESPLTFSGGISDVIIVAIPIVASLIVLMALILTHHRRRTLRDDMEATLKMEMIERGMSAEEIKRVLAARIGEPAISASGQEVPDRNG